MGPEYVNTKTLLSPPLRVVVPTCVCVCVCVCMRCQGVKEVIGKGGGAGVPLENHHHDPQPPQASLLSFVAALTFSLWSQLLAKAENQEQTPSLPPSLPPQILLPLSLLLPTTPPPSLPLPKLLLQFLDWYEASLLFCSFAASRPENALGKFAPFFSSTSSVSCWLFLSFTAAAGKQHFTGRPSSYPDLPEAISTNQDKGKGEKKSLFAAVHKNPLFFCTKISLSTSTTPPPSKRS